MKQPTLKTYDNFDSYPNFTAGHALDKRGACSCGRWSLSGASEASLVKSHQLHVQMVQLPKAQPTKQDLPISTFPERFMKMRDAMVELALRHPAYVLCSQIQVIQSIENKLWTALHHRPNLRPDEYVGSGSSK